LLYKYEKCRVLDASPTPTLSVCVVLLLLCCCCTTI